MTAPDGWQGRGHYYAITHTHSENHVMRWRLRDFEAAFARHLPNPSPCSGERQTGVAAGGVGL